MANGDSPREGADAHGAAALGARLAGGFELWIAAAPADERLAASLARRGPTAVVALDATGAESAGRIAGALGVAVGAPGAEPLDVLARALARTPARGLVAACAADLGARAMAAALSLPAGRAAAIRLDPGRASLLLASEQGWLLAHHNVADPGSLVAREEGLGRPA